ncbi:MAG: hypothetical protein DME05_25960 [Candidatus Rokuibacteriota bacterium]|nr:MAG: hypothetical protein DME05_25960 [Candidatus Rokubacteria bacterium]
MAERHAIGRVLARRSTSLAPRVLIVGGGFAGVTTAVELAKRCAGALPVHITLISDRNFFLFTPMLAEAATGAVEARHVVYPVRPLCGAWGIEFGEMFVEAIDLGRHKLVARHSRSSLRQEVQYDRLILALGARPNVAVVPGVAEHALTFKAAGDAVQIRNHVIDLFVRRRRCRTRRHRADGGARRADAGNPDSPLPFACRGHGPPRAGGKRDSSTDGDEPGRVHQGAAPPARDRDRDLARHERVARGPVARRRPPHPEPVRDLDGR